MGAVDAAVEDADFHPASGPQEAARLVATDGADVVLCGGC
jgi:hypothetical protein